MLGGVFGERINTMNDDTTDLDPADEDILTYTVSDEALEAAAGTRGANTYALWTDMTFCRPPC
jgi:hypothetical protein